MNSLTVPNIHTCSNSRKVSNKKNRKNVKQNNRTNNISPILYPEIYKLAMNKKKMVALFENAGVDAADYSEQLRKSVYKIRYNRIKAPWNVPACCWDKYQLFDIFWFNIFVNLIPNHMFPNEFWLTC